MSTSNNLISFQGSFRMCSNMVNVAMLRDRSKAARVVTIRRNQWGLLMTQVRAQLHSTTADEFSSRASELQRLTRSDAGIRDRNFCDPPVLEAAPGYPFYATASFVQISPMRSARTSKSAKMTADSPNRESIPHSGSLPGPIMQLSNADMESLYQQSSPGQILAGKALAVSSNMCPRFGILPRPIQRLSPNFGSQVSHPTKSNSDTESLCPRSSPGQILAEETLPMSSNLRYPTQLNSCRQISYTASDNRTPDQHMRMSSIFADIPGPNLAPKTTKTKREDPKSVFKKNPTRLRLAIPTELDVLAGRGGETNKHVGNMVFREEARKLRASYRLEGTSREEKFELSMVR